MWKDPGRRVWKDPGRKMWKDQDDHEPGDGSSYAVCPVVKKYVRQSGCCGCKYLEALVEGDTG